MGRRWIMVELGEHCHTHIIPRLKKVIDGEDPGGITEAVGWKGGGGFRYYRLAPSLLEKDKWGNWVISKEFNAAMLAEAVCKLEGFTYAPSDSVYWQHGHSTERDFIYVTTQHLTADQLAATERRGRAGAFAAGALPRLPRQGGPLPNLTVKKIPKAVLSRCEWGHDDYSLKVENLPKAPRKPGQQALFEKEVGKHEPSRQRHRRPSEPAPAAAPIAGNPRPHHGNCRRPERRRISTPRWRPFAASFPTVTDFEREFPSLCFALATGVGKTRLMGAFISYLHLAHGINNFFVLAPNLTIYNKLIADFTPNTPKYVFKGIAEFATDAPEIITGDNYEAHGRAAVRPTCSGARSTSSTSRRSIPKCAAEIRPASSGSRNTSAKAISIIWPACPTSCCSWTSRTATGHRPGVRAINELKPVLGLELTATPFVETSKGAVPFKNVIFDYPLGQAMADGFVKEPAVVTRKNFNPAGMSPEEIEQMKLEDGVRLHESIKVELETYARENGRRDREAVRAGHRARHDAREAIAAVDPVGQVFRGTLQEKVIQVDSSQTGAEEEEMIERLLKVEHTDEPTEIVIHVNMLKEGWDVTNLYTIVPLRAANARILDRAVHWARLAPALRQAHRRDGRGPAEYRGARQVSGNRRRGEQAGLGDPLAAGGSERPATWREDRDGRFAVPVGQPIGHPAGTDDHEHDGGADESGARVLRP